MAYVSGVPVRAKWADELVWRHAPVGWVCLIFLPKVKAKRNHVYGHADTNTRRIELAFSTDEDTTEHRWVVLHEIAHAIHDATDRNAYNRPERRYDERGKRVRRVSHPPKFWEIAISLYKRYPGILEYASQHEYKCGRKLIAQILTGESNGWSDDSTRGRGGIWIGCSGANCCQDGQE